MTAGHGPGDHDRLVWRNLVTDWHLAQDVPLDCGCDDDTADADFCAPSTAHAARGLAVRDDPGLTGPEDPWDHDTWKAAWGRNATLILTDTDVRLPRPPDGLVWLGRRLLVGGRRAVELVLYRLTATKLTAVSRTRVEADPDTVAVRAASILQTLST